MANQPRTQHVPQHVTALLSHLTSRPGVQSTLILSRKDGSIIQSTGQLAPQEPSPRSAPITAPPTDSTVSPPAQASDSTPTSPTTPAPITYQPSQAEALAAHIFTFVSSASALGISLSRPPQQLSENHTTGLDGGYDTSYGINGTSTPREEEQDGESTEREEDEEVKLLRMRTRKHEIVVVPDRKYLLCVVHDASHSNNGPGAGGSRSR